MSSISTISTISTISSVSSIPSLFSNMSDDASPKGVDSPKVWTTLITNLDYLPGLLTLHHSLQRTKSAYPFIALYTDSFPPEGHAALDARGIGKKRVSYLLPNMNKDFSNEPRFYDCWSKLTPFSMVEYERVVQLDSDMLLLQNMDELMDINLDAPALCGAGARVFAASHACVCNPLEKPHYPPDWTARNCAFSTQHAEAEQAQRIGPPATAGLSMPNGGLQVVAPSTAVYRLILDKLATNTSVSGYEFADQSLLGDLFHGRWVALPYVYNALRAMRWPGVHDAVWRDERVKNVHYILDPKPWDQKVGELLRGKEDVTVKWWHDANDLRMEEERRRGIDDRWTRPGPWS